MFVHEHDRKRKPEAWRERNEDQREELYNVEMGYDALDEEHGVEDPEVNHTQSEDFDGGSDAGRYNHVLACEVEVVVPVSAK